MAIIGLVLIEWATVDIKLKAWWNVKILRVKGLTKSIPSSLRTFGSMVKHLKFPKKKLKR